MVEKQITFTSDQKINFCINDQVLEKNVCQKMFNVFYPFEIVEIEKALTIFSLNPVCMGGPKKIDYPGTTKIKILNSLGILIIIYYIEGINDKNSYIDSTNVWHHLKCHKLTDPNRKRCTFCEKLVNIFRLKKHRINFSLRKNNKNSYISKLLTPNKKKQFCGILKTKNCIKKKNIR